MELTGYIYSLFYQPITDTQREGVGKIMGTEGTVQSIDGAVLTTFSPGLDLSLFVIVNIQFCRYSLPALSEFLQLCALVVVPPDRIGCGVHPFGDQINRNPAIQLPRD